MKKVAETAAKNRRAIELNNRYKLPGVAFVRMAKEAGCKFTFGSNNSGPDDLQRCEYGLSMVDQCKLTWQDFFVPGAWGPKAAERA
jgi:histidinol phosphatase-like PHP family hydrolase